MDRSKISQGIEIIADVRQLPTRAGLGHQDDGTPSTLTLQSVRQKPFAGFIQVTLRFRPLAAVLLALLLVMMQQGAQLHALEHDSQRMQRPQDTGLQAPVGDVACAMCALFAGGADAAAADVIAPSTQIEGFPPPTRAIALVAVASLPPYQSRAPPSTL